MRGSFKRSSP
jgi:hypothetical protein